MAKDNKRQREYFIVNLFNNAVQLIVARSKWKALHAAREYFNTSNVMIIRDRLLHY